MPHFRSITALLLFLGLCLSSPTIKASFTMAKPLIHIFSERVNFEKKVTKPYESSFFKKKKARTKGTESDTPPLYLEVTDRSPYSELTITPVKFSFLSSPYSFHFKRGPPVV